MHNIKSFEGCVRELAKLPGVGKKTAARLALHLLSLPYESVANLSKSITELKEKVKFCSKCGSLTENEVCDICDDASRSNGILCVVEEAKDVFFIENTGRFKGRYHVLGGRISPLDGIGPSNLNSERLYERLALEDITEVILAMNPDVDGEITAAYFAKAIANRAPEIKVTKLASGMPIGSHLEYIDEITVLKALENRIGF